jgi:hypothetical protein
MATTGRTMAKLSSRKGNDERDALRRLLALGMRFAAL